MEENVKGSNIILKDINKMNIIDLNKMTREFEEILFKFK